ncbi:MAG: ADP-ribosylglycohydrolase family protein [Acidobacteriota bacterium]
MHTDELLSKQKGALLGLALGDAVGTAVEFAARGSFEPLTDMVGGGPFALQPGQWTDDTSMALCLAESLIHCKGTDLRDQMGRYLAWWRDGYLSSTGECFDIGATVASALRRYHQTGEPAAGSTAPDSAGNGCIMRLAPVPIFFCADLGQARLEAAESSRTTHGAAECLDACDYFADRLWRSLHGATKEEILQPLMDRDWSTPAMEAVARAEFLEKSEGSIRGSGYVVASLEAAMWCFAETDSFEDAVLRAANLGDDADTTAAVCGQISGAFYGLGALPPLWLERLSHRELIEGLAERLAEGP